MADSERGEKTEEATQARREEFRRRGQVAQTRELASVFAIFGALLTVTLFGRYFFRQLDEVFTQSIDHFLIAAARDGDWVAAVSFAGTKTALLLAPIFGIFMVISMASSVVQVGFLYNEEALELKPDRIDPVQGFRRLFKLRSVFEGMKALAKLMLVSFVAWMVLKNEIAALPHLVEFTVNQILSYLGEIIFKLLLGVGCLMAVLAGMDFLFQRWDLEQEMRMTKEEVKEEVKSREGDPMVRARIKRMQREIASRRMMEEIPKADVVITNPTHIACVLKYDETMVAPKLVAKGVDFMAEKIKELAREHNVPIVENKPLAQALYKTVEVGETIPAQLFAAVAEVLAYLVRIKQLML